MARAGHIRQAWLGVGDIMASIDYSYQDEPRHPRSRWQRFHEGASRKWYANRQRQLTEDGRD